MDGQNVGNNNSAPNLDDVLSVLRADELYQQQESEMSPSPSQPALPYIKIIEQPAPKALRFRYECEGRSAGSIPGINSTPENRTFPTIQIVGYKGPKAVVLVSCVTKDSPYKAHPHKLVGREICKKGVCTLTVSSENLVVQFSNLGIQCVKRRDIEEALNERMKLRVDPYRIGFAHANQPGSIDLNSLRLCFQAFVDLGGGQLEPLKPVVSEPIYDKKAMADLMICKLSQCSGSAAGGAEIILLCEKVAKEDIAVRFYEEVDGKTVWEGYGEFTPTQVHKQVAIAFKTPRYRTLQIDHPVSVWIELVRPSDKACSERRQFIIHPVESERERIQDRGRKRPRQNYSESLNIADPTDHLTNQLHVPSTSYPIKTEPVESALSPNIGLQSGGTLVASNLTVLPSLGFGSQDPSYPSWMRQPSPSYTEASTSPQPQFTYQVYPTQFQGQLGVSPPYSVSPLPVVPSVSPQPMVPPLPNLDTNSLSTEISNISINASIDPSMSDSFTQILNSLNSSQIPSSPSAGNNF